MSAGAASSEGLIGAGGGCISQVAQCRGRQAGVGSWQEASVSLHGVSMEMFVQPHNMAAAFSQSK